MCNNATQLERNCYNDMKGHASSISALKLAKKDDLFFSIGQ